MVMASRGQKWSFFLPTRFLTKSLDFDTGPSWMNVSNRMGRLFDHLNVSWEPEIILHYPLSGWEKKLKLVRKWPHLDLEHFLIHRPHFLTGSDEWGLNPRLREHNNSSATISTRVWCQKTVSIEWFGTEDRARELISEFTGGLYERK